MMYQNDSLWNELSGGQSAPIEIPSTTHQLVIDANVVELTVRYDLLAETQAQDQGRQAYLAQARDIVDKLKRMSDRALARRFFKVFHVHGCFNLFDISDSERQDMILDLYNQAMKRLDLDVPSLGGQVHKAAMQQLLCGVRKVGRFDENQIIAIRSRRLEGLSYRKIALSVGVSGDMVRSICIGESYASVAKHLIEVR